MFNSKILEQLYVLRAQTATTGILHELQVQHLKNWPLMIVPNSTKASVEFDFDNKTLNYKIKAKSKKFKDRETRMVFLTEYTQELLGNEYLVNVYINGGDPIFTADRKHERTSPSTDEGAANRTSDS